MKTYVLTEEDMKAALITGAMTKGFFPADLVEDYFAGKTRVVVEQAQNGSIFSFVGDADADVLVKGKSGIPVPVPKKQKATQAVATQNVQITPENVKAALQTAMERPTSLSSIKTWTQEQMFEAIEWSMNPSNPRPAHVVERAVRGSKKKAPTAATPAETPVPVETKEGEADAVTRHFQEAAETEADKADQEAGENWNE